MKGRCMKGKVKCVERGFSSSPARNASSLCLIKALYYPKPTHLSPRLGSA